MFRQTKGICNSLTALIVLNFKGLKSCVCLHIQESEESKVKYTRLSEDCHTPPTKMFTFGGRSSQVSEESAPASLRQIESQHIKLCEIKINPNSTGRKVRRPQHPPITRVKGLPSSESQSQSEELQEKNAEQCPATSEPVAISP